MAGIMDEYDPPTPVGKMYCAVLSAEEYEDQASKCTEQALAELIQYLGKNPVSYRRVMERRKKQEEENAGLFSYAKIKMLSLLFGKDSTAVSEDECSVELDRVTTDMVKAYDYSEESKGRRRSKRLAARHLRAQENVTPLMKRSKPVVSNGFPIPPPPPPPPPTYYTPLVDRTLSRRPLSTKHQNLRSRKPSVMSEPRAPKCTLVGGDSFNQVLQDLKNPEKKRTLRNTAPRSPGGTPYTGWPRNGKCDSNIGYFNTKMADKFKNIRSPGLSSLAPPGTFESPVSPDT